MPRCEWYGRQGSRVERHSSHNHEDMGSGPNPADPASDILSALDYWVDRRVAPEKIIATKYVNDDRNQGVAFQRPLCPFPKIAKFKGQGTGGSTTEASSFECSRNGGDDDHDHDHHGDERAENR